MKTPCLDPEEFATLASLPAGHAALTNLEGCARCQARWKSYRAFLEDREDPPGSRIDEADAALSETIRRRFDPAGAREQPRRRFRFPSRPRVLILAPVAVAAVVATLVITRVADREQAPHGPMRGTAVTAWRLDPPEPRPDGGIRLSWARRPGAESYRLRIFSPALEPLLTEPDRPETTIVLDPSALAPLRRSGPVLLWRITALREGEEIGNSEVSSLRNP